MIKSPEKKAGERRALRMVVLITQIGISMMVPIFFCVFLGQWLSERLLWPLIFPLLLVVGVLAGFRSSWQIISRFTGLKADGKLRSGSGSGADRGKEPDRASGGKEKPGCYEGTVYSKGRVSPSPEGRYGREESDCDEMDTMDSEDK